MIKIKRRFNARAVSVLVLLTLALSIHVIATPCSASLVMTHATPVAVAPQTLLSIAHTGNAFPVAVAVPYLGVVRFLIAQSDIPDVLVPSVVPSAVPTFSQDSPTPQPAKVSTNVSKNTTQNSTGQGYDLGKIAGSISPFFIIALIPLLFVIGALFYFFFMGDQERRVSDEGQERRVSDEGQERRVSDEGQERRVSDEGQEAYSELSNVSEETGWREL
jgi:hypothetical protein